MSILALGRKHKEKENSQSKKGRRHKKRKKIPNQRVGVSKKGKKVPDQSSEEKIRNMQKGLWTRQYMNNTELSPNKKKQKKKTKRKETTTQSGPLPLIANQNPVHALNKNRKGKGENTQSQIPHLKAIPKISPIDP